MGQHSGLELSICVINQVTKQLVRDNANFLILFTQDDLNLLHMYSDHVNTDMKHNAFKDVCAEAWNGRYGFVVIDKDSLTNAGR